MKDLAFDSNTDFYAYQDWFSRIKPIDTICIHPIKCAGDKITIAIPTYKRANLLKEALDSAINQIGTEKYSIIVVDNNPQRNDETELLMEENAYKDIAYYKNTQNIFMGGNWNRCVELVTTPWMVLLHDDDIISPFFIREVSKAITKYPNAAVIQTRKVHEQDALAVELKETIRYISHGRFDFYMGSATSGVPSGVAYRKSCIEKLGGFPYDMYQGYSYWLHIKCINAYPYITIDAPLTYYRISKQNASTNPKLHEIWIYYMYFILQGLMKRNHVPYFISEPYIQTYIDQMEKSFVEIWESSYHFPTQHVLKIKYPYWRIRLSNKVLKIYSKILRICDQYIK